MLKVLKFIYTAYADDTSGLKPNRSKSVLAGIDLLKGLKVGLCGMRCVNLYEDTIKQLGIHFSYNKHENDENFKSTLQKLRIR